MKPIDVWEVVVCAKPAMTPRPALPALVCLILALTATAAQARLDGLSLISPNPVGFGPVFIGTPASGSFDLYNNDSLPATFNLPFTSPDVTSIFVITESVFVGLPPFPFPFSVEGNELAIIIVDVDTSTSGAKSADVAVNGDAINEILSVTGDVYDHAVASLTSGPTIDLGTFNQNASGFVNLANLIAAAAGPNRVGLQLESFSEDSDADDKFAVTEGFSALDAGDLGDIQVTFDTSTPGLFTSSYTLTYGDAPLVSDPAGAWSGQTLNFNLIGNVAVIPEPASLALLGVGIPALLRRRRR